MNGSQGDGSQGNSQDSRIPSSSASSQSQGSADEKKALMKKYATQQSRTALIRYTPSGCNGDVWLRWQCLREPGEKQSPNPLESIMVECQQCLNIYSRPAGGSTGNMRTHSISCTGTFIPGVSSAAVAAKLKKGEEEEEDEDDEEEGEGKKTLPEQWRGSVKDFKDRETIIWFLSCKTKKPLTEVTDPAFRRFQAQQSSNTCRMAKASYPWGPSTNAADTTGRFPRWTPRSSRSE